MIRTIHHKIDARRNLTKLPYNQSIPIKIIMMGHMTLKIHIAKISKITYNNIRICNRRSNISYRIKPRYRKYLIRIWFYLIFHISNISK